MFKNKEYVLAVYKEGGFTRAAEKMFVSQPSLSATVKRIEDKIGAPIFDRSNSPISLTDVGREYIKTALALESQESDFEKYIKDRSGLAVGRIRIGGTSFFSSFVLPKMISEFNELYPGIKFEIFEDSTKDLMAKLSGGELDLVIDNAVVTDGDVVCEPYITERLMLAVPERMAPEKLSPYALTLEEISAESHLERHAVDISEFSGAPFILLNSENDTGKRAEALFEMSGTAVDAVFRLDQQVTAYNIARSGLGICFVSDTLVKRMGESAGIVYYNLDERVSKRSIYLYRKKNHYLPLAAKRFTELNSDGGSSL